MSAITAFFDQARTGFSRTFWIANTIELFERLAYYATTAVLAIYIAERVGLGPVKASFLTGSLFTTLIYLLPPLAGTIVDRFGFKKSLIACFSIFCLGYFLIGLGGLPLGQPLVELLGAPKYMVLALIIAAAGGSLIKPCIVGVVARTTSPDTKSLGYSIYYTLVNLGGAVGPLLALQVRENIGISYVLVMSSLVSLGLVVGTMLFFKEPPRPADAPPAKSMARVLGDMFMVFTNLKFMSFLVIFSGFWIMFWQIFLSLPYFVRDVLHYEDFEKILTVDAWTIILITIPITALAKKMKPLAAMTLGFGIASASWLLIGTFPTLILTIAAIAIYAIGEGLQAPRFYDYVADLAPKAQIGTYMGFAFLPVAIGSFVAGAIAGPLVERYVGVRKDGIFTPGPDFSHAGRMWFWVGGIGVVATLAMLAYDRLVVKRR